ncbi:MAG TPA: MerR family transcriptional regulator [Pirellulales bacterium]|nr:MerR family transcriptional regulator [Pirellulales bacterium]
MIVKPESALLNVGSYPIDDAARLLGVPRATVRRWLQLLIDDRSSPAQNRTVSFAELLALHIVKLFRDAGVPLSIVKRLSQAAGTRFRTLYPFAAKRFQAEGQSLIGALRDEVGMPGAGNDWSRCEKAFAERVLPFLEGVDFEGPRGAARYWPLGRAGRIVLDPERKFGAPIDDESGVPVKAIFAAVVAGGGQEPQTVAEWLDVSLESVRAAVTFVRRFGS